MVAGRLTDGVRIAQLFASEVTGDRGRLREVDVTDADPDVEPTPDGALAFRLVEVDAGRDENDRDDDPGATGGDETGATAGEDDGEKPSEGDALADVYVQPDRARIEFRRAPEAVADAAVEAGLRVRPKAVRPPRTLVFLEDGTDVKRALPALETVVEGGDNA
ncbi:hypothetical protein [Halorubrum cibi]|uniref:DUF7993 domain-containing protein n=1 Tax=Halorubrum cibi TaxID=413815 RepID=A0A521AD58_9EURY|nr:hypothetical protein [Halorubrum cibi]SMO32752.1 hypothetical protein SAMN06264867_10170 [Halorubrum cibi]